MKSIYELVGQARSCIGLEKGLGFRVAEENGSEIFRRDEDAESTEAIDVALAFDGPRGLAVGKL